ncbi:hypothetical protein OIV19_08335 [Brucella sp. HL-2]|nr:hypothetical protein [Brucella sp. HL-2]MCV9907621.1 hypothetical protein [Brucella sp. HL-2]
MGNLVQTVALSATVILLITGTFARFWLCTERAACLHQSDDNDDILSQEDCNNG